MSAVLIRATALVAGWQRPATAPLDFTLDDLEVRDPDQIQVVSSAFEGKSTSTGPSGSRTLASLTTRG